MKSRISATEAVRNFSQIINRVRYRGESFVVERGGQPICEILPAGPPSFRGADLIGLLRALPKPDDDYLAVLEDLLKTQATMAESQWQR
jgi:antitoxin (DNA-binding transcriptional repressor) of toxin-antitoxin stability system